MLTHLADTSSTSVAWAKPRRQLLIGVEHGRRGLVHERLFDIADALKVQVGELLP
jgi:hypothetical protein